MSGQELAGETPGDDVYDVLRNVRRRYVIYYLKARDDPVPITELADRIVGWEGPESNGNPKAKRRSVYNALIQTHLPKLDRHGFVHFDRHERTVRPASRVDAVEVYPASETVEWSRYFVLLSAVTLALGGLDLLGPAGPVAPLPWEPFVLVGFVLLAVAFEYDRYRWRLRFQREGPDIVIDEVAEG